MRKTLPNELQTDNQTADYTLDATGGGYRSLARKGLPVAQQVGQRPIESYYMRHPLGFSYRLGYRE